MKLKHVINTEMSAPPPIDRQTLGETMCHLLPHRPFVLLVLTSEGILQLTNIEEDWLTTMLREHADGIDEGRAKGHSYHTMRRPS